MEREATLYHGLKLLSPGHSRNGGEEDSLISSQDIHEREDQARRGRQWLFNAGLIANLSLLVILSVLFTTIITSKKDDRKCLEQLSIYSPVFEAVEYIEFDFDNAFNSTSIYRGPPTPEREAAWHELSDGNFIQIPEDKLLALNRSKQDNMLHVPSDHSTGYLAMVEVFHQLHCLNLIRMYTWLQAGKYEHPPGGLTSSPVGNRMHVDHCIETLRIALMCHADVTPVLAHDDPSAPIGARADFNAHHKCRNFDKISDWVKDHKAA